MSERDNYVEIDIDAHVKDLEEFVKYLPLVNKLISVAFAEFADRVYDVLAEEHGHDKFNVDDVFDAFEYVIKEETLGMYLRSKNELH